jgi:sRNA-binding regulator protein Hfq
MSNSKMKPGDLAEALGADSKGRVMSTSTKRRVKKEGHDELIAKLTPPGTTARLVMNSGLMMVGELAGSDRFTISLHECVMLDKDEEGNDIGYKMTDDDRKVQIVYKHSIESFNLHVHGDRDLERTVMSAIVDL